MTSVGSGSLIIVLLLALYPRLRAGELVGTDLVQAVPLVGVGRARPRCSSATSSSRSRRRCSSAHPRRLHRRPAVPPGPRRHVVRRALALVLLASGLKLLNLPDVAMVAALATVGVAGPLLWMAARRWAGLPASWRTERKLVREAEPVAS